MNAEPANAALTRLIEQLQNYEDEIKKTNLLNEDLLAEHIEAVTANIIWKNDKYYQEQLALFKDSAENISSSCTKFAKLLTLTRTSEAISSISDEIAVHSYNLFTYYSLLAIHPLGKPLYKVIIYNILGLLHHLIALVNIGWSDDYSDLNSITGIIWEICDKIRVIPISNKAAFKRNFLENICKIKDVIREFSGYVDETNNNNNNNNNNDNDNDNGNDNSNDNSNNEINDDKADSDDVNEFYNNDELILVQKCIQLMERCVATLKVCNDVMTIVADNVDTNNIESSKIACRRWVNKLVVLCDVIDEAVINLGAELYAPILDIVKVETHDYTIVHNHLCTMRDLLVAYNDLQQYTVVHNNNNAEIISNNNLLENIIEKINLL